jgi:CspA family cold shock protein
MPDASPYGQNVPFCPSHTRAVVAILMSAAMVGSGGVGGRKFEGMSTGTVLRFDVERGYGVIAPEDGGEDVFVDARELGERKDITCGTRVSFTSTDGAKGPKAFSVEVLGGPLRSPTRPTEATRPRSVEDRAVGPDDGELCEVLTEEEYSREITDVLMSVIPDCTAAQIVEVRTRMNRLARPRGWLDG